MPKNVTFHPYTEWPINIRFVYLEDSYEESIVIVLETLPHDDNIGSKKLWSLLIIFSENGFLE